MGIDVLVPVLARPESAQPLAESLSVTVTPCRLLFICSPADWEQIAACEAVGEVLIVPWAPGRADYAKKINYGFAVTESEWIFSGADDIRFSAGWDVHALALAHRQRRRVIGTNDLHNPLVLKGRGSTHTLIARSYIEECGGTEDGTGAVFCELYDHQCIDMEFIEVAKKRGEFVFSRNSVVEHFHPHWGNAQSDKTYKKATRATMADLKLYRERMGLRPEKLSRRRSNRPRV